MKSLSWKECLLVCVTTMVGFIIMCSIAKQHQSIALALYAALAVFLYRKAGNKS